jgi:hypothetical protein
MTNLCVALLASSCGVHTVRLGRAASRALTFVILGDLQGKAS